MKTIHKIVAVVAVVSVLLFAACKKEGGNAYMKVRMTDAPSPYAYQEVNIDVQGVEAHIDGEGWISLPTVAGTYNVLELVNGVDVLIAADAVPAGILSQVRLILVANNTIKVNDVVYPLTIPSGQESGLKINVHEEVIDDDFSLIIDFDAAKSIHQQGNGQYKMHPVIRGYTLQNSGAIKGEVSIKGPGIAIIAEGNGNTYTTYANKQSGRFLIRGIVPGTYTLKIYQANSDIPIILPDIMVRLNSVTDLNMVLLP